MPTQFALRGTRVIFAQCPVAVGRSSATQPSAPSARSLRRPASNGYLIGFQKDRREAVFFCVKRSREAPGNRRRHTKVQEAREGVSKPVIIGWTIELVGIALWLYGYLATGNPSLIDWPVNTPWWVAGFLPNIESEIGMALVFAGMVPIY
jgi:hypothetical protein